MFPHSITLLLFLYLFFAFSDFLLLGVVNGKLETIENSTPNCINIAPFRKLPIYFGWLCPKTDALIKGSFYHAKAFQKFWKPNTIRLQIASHHQVSWKVPDLMRVSIRLRINENKMFRDFSSFCFILWLRERKFFLTLGVRVMKSWDFGNGREHYQLFDCGLF